MLNNQPTKVFMYVRVSGDGQAMDGRDGFPPMVSSFTLGVVVMIATDLWVMSPTTPS